MHTLKTIAKTFGSTFKIIKFICITSRVSPVAAPDLGIWGGI